MSREIKFRAWLPHFNEMREVASIDFTDDTLMTKGDTTLFNFNESFAESFDTARLMEFTGLKDRNGREIFEGDVIERSLFDLKKGDYTRKSEVHFLEGSFCIYTEDWFSQPLSDDIAKECEVIGNIYQDGGLLK